MGIEMLFGVPYIEKVDTQVNDPLVTGILSSGSPDKVTGLAWNDDTNGMEKSCATSNYGDGVRYEMDETRFMTKIPGKRDRNGNIR